MNKDTKDFVYWLAYLLGYANPQEMLDEMEPYQVGEWAEFFKEHVKEILCPRIL